MNKGKNPPRMLREITLAEESFSIKGRFELKAPPAVLVKEIIPSLVELEPHFEGDQLQLLGKMRALCLFVGTDRGVHSRELEQAFCRVLSQGQLKGRRGLKLDPRVTVTYIELEGRPGQEYGSAVTFEVEIRVRVMGREAVVGGGSQEIPPFLQEQVLVEGEEVVGTETIKFMEEHQLELSYPASRVVEIKTEINTLEARPLQGQILLEGSLSQQVFYVGADGVLHHQEVEFPLRHNHSMPGVGAESQIHLETQVSGVKYRLGGDKGRYLEERVFWELRAKVTGPRELLVLTAVEEPGPALERQLVFLNRVVAQGETNQILEHSLVLKLPAREISKVDVQVGEIEGQVVAGRVLIQGKIKEDIYPLGEDGLEYHQEQELDFNAQLELEGILPGMEVRLQPVVEEASAQLGDQGRSVEQRLLLRLAVKVVEGTFLPVVTGMEGGSWGVEKALLDVERLVGEARGRVLEETEVDLMRYCRKVVRVEAKVVDLTWEVIADKLLVAGTVDERLYYVTREGAEYHQQHRFSFNHVLEVTGAKPGMAVLVWGEVEYLQHTLNPDGDVLSQRLMLAVEAQVREKVQQEVVTGLRPLEGQELVPLVAEESYTILLDSWIELPHPHARHLLETRVRVQEHHYQVEEGEVEVRGTLRQELYYVGKDNRLHYYQEVSPFAQRVELPEAEPTLAVEGDLEIKESTGELVFHPWSQLGSRVRMYHCLDLYLQVTPQKNVIPG